MQPLTLAAVDPAGALVLIEAIGDGWQRRPLADAGRWPAWRPGGGLLAASVVEPDGSNSLSSRIDLFGTDGVLARHAYVSPHGTPAVIAPRVPHYVMWSPRGDTLAFVTQGRGSLDLRLSSVDGLLQGVHIASGAPIFGAWSPDGERLAVHAGSELFLVRSASPMERTHVEGQAIGFRTPAFSSDGTLLAYALPAPPGVTVMASSPPGEPGRPVSSLAGGVALDFRPGSHELTLALTRDPETGLFDALSLVDLDQAGARPRRVARGPFAAFAWSPAGDRLALIVPTQSGDGRYALHIRAADGRLLAATEGFLPSPDQRTAFGFFDQYTRSHCPWAPDGSAIAVSGRLAGDALAASFSDGADPRVLVWRPGPHRPFEDAGPGDVAFFAPPASEA